MKALVVLDRMFRCAGNVRGTGSSDSNWHVPVHVDGMQHASSSLRWRACPDCALGEFMATRVPQGYTEAARWDIAEAPKWLWVVLAALSIAALLATWWVAAVVLSLAHGAWEVGLDAAALLLSLSLGTVMTVVLHEVLHGISFLACGARPRFGFKPWTRLGPVFYASAPGYCLRKGEYVAVGLAPLTLLTAALFVALVLLPLDSIFTYTAFLMAGFNVAGSVGDIFIVRMVLSHASESYFEDRGDGFTVYGKAPETEASLDS